MEELVEEIDVEEKIKKKANIYTDKQRVAFYYFNRIEFMKATPSRKKGQESTNEQRKLGPEN